MAFPFPFIIPAQKGALPSLVYRTSAVDQNDLTNYSFAGQDIGAVGLSRYVIVAVAHRNGGGIERTISSATIDGVPATVLAHAHNAGTAVDIIGALVNTANATGTIAINLSGGTNRMAIAVWTAYNLASTVPFHTTTSTSSAPTLDLNTSADGLLVAIGANANNSASFLAGVTVNLPSTLIESTVAFTVGSASLVATATPRSIIGTTSGGPIIAAWAAASWR